ncbi:MAG: TatD family nuclease-associated radical SAM protein [bacterium]|nr:TatD family nuclease-associated radical SAM protein [bacterium]
MTTAEKQNLVYFVSGKMYINLTNLCTCKCVFCIRDLNATVEGVDMHLDNLKADADEVIKYINELSDKIGSEVVFCGYGEPMIELESLEKVAKYVKENYPNVKIRVNTNGHANLIYKRDVLPELVGLVDTFSVSLNAENADLYKKITQCCYDADIAYQGMKDFIKESVKLGFNTYATVVDGFDGAKVDVKMCEKIAVELGANFRVREYLNEGYS